MAWMDQRSTSSVARFTPQTSTSMAAADGPPRAVLTDRAERPVRDLKRSVPNAHVVYAGGGWQRCDRWIERVRADTERLGKRDEERLVKRRGRGQPVRPVVVDEAGGAVHLDGDAARQPLDEVGVESSIVDLAGVCRHDVGVGR